MTDLVRADPPAQPTPAGALVGWAQAAQAAHQLAQAIVKTAFCPKAYRGLPDEATAAILAGAEVGLSPIASLNAFDNIQGTVAPKAVALRAIVQAQGHEVWPEKVSDTEVIVCGTRRGSARVVESRWTIARAEKLGLTGKDNWRKQPGAMLMARATAECCRLVASDAILGTPYAAEEMDGWDAEPRRTVKRATRGEVVRVPSGQEIQQIGTVVELPVADEPPLDETVPRPWPIPPQAGRVTDDEPAGTPAPPRSTDVAPLIGREGLAATDAQLKKIHASFTELGWTDRDDRLRAASTIAQRPLTSSKDLTRTEATDLIDVMTHALGAVDAPVLFQELLEGAAFGPAEVE